MKTRTLSQVTLLIGLTVGLSALWAGSAPFAGINKTVLGGFSDTYVDGGDVATNWDNCYPKTCSGTTYQPCSYYSPPSGSCWGSYIDVAACYGSGTILNDGLSNCTGSHSYCTSLYVAKCDFDH